MQWHHSTVASAALLCALVAGVAPSAAQPAAQPKGSSRPAATAAPSATPDAGPGASAEPPAAPPPLVEVAPPPPAASTPEAVPPAPAAGQRGWCPCGPPGSREAAFRCACGPPPGPPPGWSERPLWISPAERPPKDEGEFAPHEGTTPAERYEKLETAGTAMFFSGLGLAAVGALIIGIAYSGDRSTRDVLVMGGGAFCVVGGGVAVLGIPLWAVGASGSN
jgi:hypothetical protein